MIMVELQSLTFSLGSAQALDSGSLGAKLRDSSLR